uniref:Uncharacterized protein n=1 Tax=Rhizophora mucronata TaxID=61149 RepID=A0A2P2QDI5_RHIMU
MRCVMRDVHVLGAVSNLWYASIKCLRFKYSSWVSPGSINRVGLN